MKHAVVLVVEDMPQVRATAIRMFEEFGCTVFDAYDSRGALNILEAHPEITALFADIRLPGMNGIELAEAARRRRPDLNVVLTSGYVGREGVPEGLPFVPKPWRAQDLVGTVLATSH